MAKKAKTAGMGYLEEVLGEHLEAALAVIPEDKREATLDALGAGVLRQSDYSRLADEATATKKAADEIAATAEKRFEEAEKWQTQLNTWFGEQQVVNQKLREGIEAQRPAVPAGGGSDIDPDDDPNGRPITPVAPVIPEGYVKREELETAIGNIQAGIARQGATLVGALHDMHLTHVREFGDDFLDKELFDHCEKIGRPADQGGYDSFVMELRKTKSETDRKQEVEDAEKRGEERAIERLSSGTPYPVGGAPAFDGGTLRHLGKDKGPEVGVDAAVRSVMKMRRDKAAGIPS